MFDRIFPETLSAYAVEYGTLHDICPETRRQYQIAVGVFDRWAGHSVRLDELDERSVSLFLRDYADRVAPATVRSKRVQLLALWRAAADDGLCDLPTRRVRPARVPWTAPVAWTHSEVELLLGACRGLKRPHNSGLSRPDWWSLAIRVAWDLGLRWADQMLRLRVAAIAPGGILAFPQHKTGRVVIVRLSEPTLEALRASLVIAPRDLVTPWTSSHATFGDQFQRIIDRAGVRPGTWKYIRKSGATNVEIQRPGAATRHLGHAPGSMIAARHYIDPTIVNAEFLSPAALTPPPPPRTGGFGNGPHCLRRAKYGRHQAAAVPTEASARRLPCD